MNISADYAAFLAKKAPRVHGSGISTFDPGTLNPMLFDFQRDVTAFLLRIGRGAAFQDTGLGKTAIQLEWARVVAQHTGGMVLILTPLAVAAQTLREAAKFHEDGARIVTEQEGCGPGINITNYEKLDHFDPTAFHGVVLDESSILKSFDGRTKRRLCEAFASTPFRLCCTATPAPNDFVELGNHSEFLGVMPMDDMLPRWFINDTSDTGTWRLKGHARQSFWRWVATWAACIGRPSDCGYDGHAFDLPELIVKRHVVQTDPTEGRTDELFRSGIVSATGMHKEKRITAADRADMVAQIVADKPNEPWVIWCDSDYEETALCERIPSAMAVRGSMSSQFKEVRLTLFSEGKERIIVTKPSIAGFGLNWQHCANVAFVGLSYSYEQYYQAIRRCWRYGQERPVNVHVVLADTELGIMEAINRKAADHAAMKADMAFVNFKPAERANKVRVDYQPNHKGRLPSWL